MKKYALGLSMLIIFLTFASFGFLVDSLAAPALQENDCCPGGVCPPNLSSPVGSNLGGIRDWSTELVFVDAFKASRSWIPQSSGAWDTGESALLDLDEHGWVRSLPQSGDPEQYRWVATLLFININGHYPAGEYVVLYDGEGTIEYSWNAVKNSAASTPGRDVLTVIPTDSGIFMAIKATDPNGTGDYIRNIRFIMPGYEATYETQIFHPDFLDSIAKYKSLRFMDWMHTNGATQSAWADRPEELDVRYTTSDGVPLETMLDLVDRTSADPWFTMPHMATDEYMTEFAIMARDNLSSTQRVYVEYSNEVWNSGFGQASWVEAQGQAEWPSTGDSGYTKRLNWFGKHSAEMCTIWKTAWGDQSDRVVCVMGAQSANPWTGNQALECPLWSGGPCDTEMDAVAIAPYFGGYLGNSSVASEVEAWTSDPDGGLDKLFTELESGGLLTNSPSGGAVQDAINDMNAYALVAAAQGVDLIAYEGGQHLAGVAGVENNSAITTLFTDANRDARMGTLYTQYLDGWKSAGGHHFAHFLNMGEYSKWGSWGAMEYWGQTSMPKYTALMDYIDDNPCTWDDCQCPGGSVDTPTATATITATITETPLPGSTSTPTPTPTNTSPPIATPTVTSTATPTLMPSPTATPHLAEVAYADPAPTIDGVKDAIWTAASSYPVTNFLLGSTTSTDFSAVFQTLYDQTNLYILVQVIDDALVGSDGASWWEDDSVEVFLDGNHSGGGSYDGIDDYQLGFRWTDLDVLIGLNSPAAPAGTTFQMASTADGYILEAAIPWSGIYGVTAASLMAAPPAGTEFGLDVQANDNDNGAGRASKIAWNATVDDAWQFPNLFGDSQVQNSPLAVSLAHVHGVRENDGSIVFRWETVTETGYAGFNVYLETESGEILMTPEMILSDVIDSVTPTRYTFTASGHSSGERYFIEIVKISGSSQRYGPFLLGTEYGVVPVETADHPIFLPIITER